MRSVLRGVTGVVVAAGIAISAIGAAMARSPESLGVRTDQGWETWWRREASPRNWNGRATLAQHVSWLQGARGLDWGELELRGASEAWRTRLIVVRVDPGAMDLSLEAAFTQSRGWTIADADSTVALALDAGQFRHSLPWGWVVSKGEELLQPEYAPLAGAVVVDSLGAVRIVAPDDVAAERERGAAREAFQSYPMLLQAGIVPTELLEPGKGVDLEHRDARLALGTLEDGKLIIALTRFDALGPPLGRVPLGLTTPEMAAIMGGLGCGDAVLLDGGISSQLMLRTASQARRRWVGTRSVPLGLVGRPKRVSP
jgi:hypothetical protein